MTAEVDIQPCLNGLVRGLGWPRHVLPVCATSSVHTVVGAAWTTKISIDMMDMTVCNTLCNMRASHSCGVNSSLDLSQWSVTVVSIQAMVVVDVW